ncbi:MAG: helix-turn-helix domain-containing protein [Sulfitobacter sp.]
MARFETNFCSSVVVKAKPFTFEIFVAPGFSGLEVASITQTLTLANDIAHRDLFRWRMVSDTPGLVNGAGDMIIRAHPAIDDYGFSDAMVVVGGTGVSPKGWLSRARQMQRKGLTVALLSDAATAYIRSTRAPSGHVTTHWHDAALLNEAGYHPDLTDRLSEKSDGIITAAGVGATAELVIGLIAPHLDARQVAELGNRLLLPTIRKSDAAQPRDISGNASLFDDSVARIVSLMEETVAEPLCMPHLTEQIGLSTRHVERLFRDVFQESPARFYKQLRTRKAWTMIEETLIPLADIAAATGFKTAGTMAKAVQSTYGDTPTKLRSRKNRTLLKFA